MGRQIKSRLSILTMSVILVSMLLTGYMVFSSGEVLAAEPQEGAFHLKKYADMGTWEEASGQQEDTDNPTHFLYGKEVIAGVSYEIYRIYDYVDGKLVEIESGPVAVLDSGENYKTDANGEINITGLPLGQYMFKEVSAPEGVQINTTEYYFTLPTSVYEEGESQYEVYVYPKNVRLTGSLDFMKVGDNGTDGLKNVEFQVYKADGSPVKDNSGNVLTITTRLSGQAAIEDLAVGKYYLIETKNPDTDYVTSSTTKYWFEIYSDNGEVKSRSFYEDASMESRIKDADGLDLEEGIIINYKVPEVEKTASAKSTQDITDGLIYVDSDGNLYANVDIPYVYTITTTLPKDLGSYKKFEIYDAFDVGNIVLVTELADIAPVAKGGNRQLELVAGVDYEVVREGAAGYRLLFTERGIAALAEAKCTIIEVTFDAKIPKGYKVDGQVKVGEKNEAGVEFTTDHSDPSESATENTVYPRAGEITVYKVDKDNTTKLLAGATFSLKDASGNEYWGTEYVTYLNAKGKITKKVEEATGFIFTQLPYGTYTLKETKAPAGYVLSTETITINLTAAKNPTDTWISHEETVANKAESTSSSSDSTSSSAGNTSTGSGKGSSPTTGDQTRILLYIIGFLGSSMAIVYFYRKRKKRNRV